MKKVKTSPAVRQAKIREILQVNEQASIQELARKFGTSEMTIRRDLERLEQSGQIRRTHGGALPAERMIFEYDFAIRRQKNVKKKNAIARRALELIYPRHRIIIDAGTTTLQLAILLRDKKDITVITPSLAVASVLQFAQGVETVLLGGIVRYGSPDLTGIVTENNLEMFGVDIAFQGADGIDLEGNIYTEDLRIAKVDQKIRQRAAQTYLLADSSKFGKTALVRNGTLKDLDAVITDEKIAAEHKQILSELGVRLIIANTKS